MVFEPILSPYKWQGPDRGDTVKLVRGDTVKLVWYGLEGFSSRAGAVLWRSLRMVLKVQVRRFLLTRPAATGTPRGKYIRGRRGFLFPPFCFVQLPMG